MKPHSTLRLLGALAMLAVATGCPPAGGPPTPTRAPLAQKWLDRARAEYGSADVDEAADAIRSALQVAPDDFEVKTWAGRIALARLEYAETLRLLAGVQTSEARGLRGRAHWYAGDIDAAADELEAMLADPEVKDGWAKAIAGLARRGTGRKPFQLSGGLLAVTEMPRVMGTLMVVPVEIDGEQALALVATGTAEVTLDSSTRKEPSWVSLRFGGKVEVKDVPAMVQDLSGLSRQLNAPIKALLGVNLLRHVNATFDFTGGQFVVRTFTPPAPPNATRVPAYYFKGGGMAVKSALSPAKDAVPAALLVDTGMTFPIALDDDGWKKAGIDFSKLTPVPGDAKLKQGELADVRLGAFDIPNVPAVSGAPIADIEKSIEVNLDGVLGSGLLAAFRITLSEEGRALWLEELPMAAPSAPPPAAGTAPALTPPTLEAPPAGALPPAPSGKPAPGKPPAKGAAPRGKKPSD